MTSAILLLAVAGAVAPLPALVAAALLGAIVGFAPFNKPVAQIFLGDVGSLPIGLLLGWLLLGLAATGHLAAALILPLYYLADATITLVWRMARRETIWQAHRTHFYQRASDRGLTVLEIVTRVFLVNLMLAGLAFITVAAQSRRVAGDAERRCRNRLLAACRFCERQAPRLADFAIAGFKRADR